MSNKLTYSISAYNLASDMCEVMPMVYTSKATALDIARKMKALGAKQVQVITNKNTKQ